MIIKLYSSVLNLSQILVGLIIQSLAIECTRNLVVLANEDPAEEVFHLLNGNVIAVVSVQFVEHFSNCVVVWVVLHPHFLANVVDEVSDLFFVEFATIIDIDRLEDLRADMMECFIVAEDDFESLKRLLNFTKRAH